MYQDTATIIGTDLASLRDTGPRAVFLPSKNVLGRSAGFQIYSKATERQRNQDIFLRHKYHTLKWKDKASFTKVLHPSHRDLGEKAQNSYSTRVLSKSLVSGRSVNDILRIQIDYEETWDFTKFQSGKICSGFESAANIDCDRYGKQPWCTFACPLAFLKHSQTLALFNCIGRLVLQINPW